MLVRMSFSEQKFDELLAARKMLNKLTFCEQPLNISGNFQAKQRKAKHDNSKMIFPMPVKEETEKYKSHYVQNFPTNKTSKPESCRPRSPTRRNNPHPSKDFLYWRIPTRVHGNTKFAYPPFDKDCSINKETIVDQKYLTKLAKAQAKNDKQLSTCLKNEQTKKVEESLVSILQRNWSPQESFTIRQPKAKRKSQQRARSYVSPRMYDLNSNNDGFQPPFNSWYDSTYVTSQITQQTPDPTQTEPEESYLKQALEVALQPDAIQALENWLLEANDEERAMAIQLIKTIILASEKQKQTDTNNTPPGLYSPVSEPVIKEKTKIKRHHHLNLTMKKACGVCRQQELETVLKQIQQNPSWDMPSTLDLLKPRQPTLIEENERKREIQLFQTYDKQQRQYLLNKCSIFDQSTKPKYGYYTIHPEWE